MGAWQGYQPGRCFVGRLSGDEDLIQAVTALGVEKQITTAAVSVTGRVTRATIGTYDPSQQVYITRQEERPMEIVACRGLLTTGEPRPFLHAHILLADENTIIGGRLFSETRVTEAECIIEEFRGPIAYRRHDAHTGQLVLAWQSTEQDNAGP